MNKEQYKTYLRQRLTENLLITEVTASPEGNVPPTRGPRLERLATAIKNPFMSKNKRNEIISLIAAKSGKLPYDQEAEVAATPGGDRQAKVGRQDPVTGEWSLVDAPWKANAWAYDLNRNASFAADEANEFRRRRQGRPEENQMSSTIASHPHGALTGVLARHLGLDASDVFETTSALTADSPQEHVDNAMGNVISQHGGRLFNKLSNEPDDPYHTPPARHRYTANPERDYDESYDIGSEEEHERFMGDLIDHIHDNMSNGVHTEFTGAPRYDGI